MQCRVPPLTNGLTNGRTSVYRVQPGMSVTFTCDSGYYLDGSSSLQCVDRGDDNPEWNLPIPVCRQGRDRHHITILKTSVKLLLLSR